MKQPDENPLLKEILLDDKLSALQRASLDHGLDAMRRARRFRRALRAGMLALLPVLLILMFKLHKPTQEIAGQPSTQGTPLTGAASVASGESSVTMISDEELFTLFPGRSLALIGKPGHQQLVFLDIPTSH